MFQPTQSICHMPYQRVYQKGVDKQDKTEVAFFKSTPFSHIWAKCDPCAETKLDVIINFKAGNQAVKIFHNKQTHFSSSNFSFIFNKNINFNDI